MAARERTGLLMFEDEEEDTDEGGGKDIHKPEGGVSGIPNTSDGRIFQQIASIRKGEKIRAVGGRAWEKSFPTRKFARRKRPARDVQP